MNINNELIKLQKYMLTIENINRINEFNNNLNNKNEQSQNTKYEKIKKVFEVKNYKDYFIQKLLEFIEYENKNKQLIKLINLNEFNYKLKTEINYYFIEKLDKLEKRIKNKEIEKPKLFKIKQVILDLGNEENMTLESFIACCYIEKLNILFVNKKLACYIENKSIVDNPELYYLNMDKEIITDKVLIKYNSIKNDYYFVDNIIKPFKSVSSYKVDELKNIALYFNIELKRKEKEKNKTKQELYTDILEYINC
jgi:hypothetical protein